MTTSDRATSTELDNPGEVAKSATRHKIRGLEDLAETSAAAKRSGKSVVLCHGVFDLVHLGHIRHFEAAKREGDILIVTLTADKFVRKGPGRPIFAEHMRAEMLAAIESIDLVGIVFEHSAESVINAIQPDVYVKGSDYENPDDDITGKIRSEQGAVKRHGGRVVYTKDITFSSSALINRHLDVFDPPLRDYLEAFREGHSLDDLIQLIESVRDFRVLLVGDSIIDEYQYVSSLGKSAKENIIATQFEGREEFAGGVLAAANHIAEFCAEVEIITVSGGLDSREDVMRNSLRENVSLTVLQRPDIPTTRKIRFVDPNYMRKMFEVYHFDDSAAAPTFQAELNLKIAQRARDADLVVVTDFGHGMIAPSTVNTLVENAKFLAVNAQTNAGNKGFNLVTRYPRADYVCIDGVEARLAVQDKFGDLQEIAAEGLPSRMSTSRVIITGGVTGCVTYEAGAGTRHIPVFTKTIVDTVGAGDAFLAVTAPLVAAGGEIESIGFIGNAAGALKVGIVGHRASVEKVPLVKFITTLMK